jgi:hypothetical protein
MKEHTNQESRKFLEALFSRYFNDHDGFIELRFISKDGTDSTFSKFYKLGNFNDSAIWEDIQRLNTTHHVCLGVNPRPLSKDKKESDIKDVVCLWADIDG